MKKTISPSKASDEEQIYVLLDSWYTSEKLVDACNANAFLVVIGGVKSNRKIYPTGMGISMNEFAGQYIQNPDLRSVTAKGKGKYRIYEYEGPISDIENAKVLLSWEKKFSQDQKPFCILCTDISLDVVTILEYYNVRWEIETGYRYFKELLGFY